jgi:hypothetical protein
MNIVKKQGKQWAVYKNGVLIEGGFFTREAAEDCAYRLNVAKG